MWARRRCWRRRSGVRFGYFYAMDGDRLRWPVACAGGYLGDSVRYLLALEDLAENGVRTIQVRSGNDSNEELATVGVRARIGHG